MTFGIYTNYTQQTFPMYGQPGFMAPVTFNSPSLFMAGGCIPPMVGGCYDTFGGMGMMGYGYDCCCGNGYGGYDDGGKLTGLEKGLLIGAGAAVGAGLIVRFAKPIGKFFSTVGKGIWSGLKWTGNMIAKGAKGVWNGMKWVGKKIGQGAKWLWNHTLGKLFNKKDKTETENTGNTAATKTTTETE